MNNLFRKYFPTLAHIERAAPFSPDISLILGSGLGEFVDKLNIIATISSTELPGYPHSSVPGHSGKLHFAEYRNKKLLIFQGRVHFYEGYSLDKCLISVLICKHLGARYMILTNAAGGINSELHPGDLMLNSSLISFNIKHELTEIMGLANYEARKSFLQFPSPVLTAAIRTASQEINTSIKQGTYWYCKGPSYETPAEIEMIRRSGGDAVGMSTVYEAIYAAYLGIETAAISCITNYAAGISTEKLSHNEVTETANKVKYTFESLLKKSIELL